MSESAANLENNQAPGTSPQAQAQQQVPIDDSKAAPFYANL